MIEPCFTQLEYYLKQITNESEELPFTQPRRLVREKPDFDFIKASVSEGNPYCLITIADYAENPLGTLFRTYITYTVGSITHLGTGTATYAITGDHEGNNTFLLEITTSGIIGTEPYPQYRLKQNDGEFSTPQDIPADGAIAIPDNTIFTFEVGGAVVADDTYAWQTFALRANITKEKAITLRLRAAIWAKTKKELFATGGYFDQLSKLLVDRFVTDGEQAIRQSPGPSRWIQGEFERENDLIQGALEITYQGAIYSSREDALVCKVVLT